MVFRSILLFKEWFRHSHPGKYEHTQEKTIDTIQRRWLVSLERRVLTAREAGVRWYRIYIKGYLLVSQFHCLNYFLNLLVSPVKKG